MSRGLMGRTSGPFGLLLILFWTSPVFCSSLSGPTGQEYGTPSKPALQSVDLTVPAVFYYLSAPLRIPYKLHKTFHYGDYTINLLQRHDNSTVYSQKLSFNPRDPRGLIEIPCTTLLYPGHYTLQLQPLNPSPNSPEIISDLIEIRWFGSIKWHLSSRDVRMFSQPLGVNTSLFSRTTCPQQEPANVTLFVDLNYGTQLITSRRVVWPFGTTRSPINTTVQFPCQFFDRRGSYYASLSLIYMGRRVILDLGPTVNASQRLTDYALHVSGDIGRCGNASGKTDGEGMRVTYQAPPCVGGDKIRLYRVEHQSRGASLEKENVKEVYIMERSIRSRPRFASFHFPCDIFATSNRTDVLGFCWVYTSFSRDGQADELQETRQCLPASVHAEKGSVMIRVPEWSTWTPWTECTQTCRKNADDVAIRMRTRFCQATGGYFRKPCLGSGFETKPCLVPLCQTQQEELEKKFAEVVVWFSNKSEIGRALEPYQMTYIVDLYLRGHQKATLFLQTETGFLTVVFIFCATIILLTLCCLLPHPCRVLNGTACRSKDSQKKNPDRDSHYALINRDDDPASHRSNLALSQIPDQPSRSGAVELTTFPQSRQGTLKPQSAGACNGHAGATDPPYPDAAKAWPKYVPSPLLLQRICNEQRGKRSETEQQSPRSSSHVSSRPEADDMTDFEYDDFIPDQVKEEEWPGNVKIEIFATAYEDILNELNASSRDDLDQPG